MRITMENIIDEIAKTCAVDKATAYTVVTEVCDIITNAVCDGDVVSIRGFGKFEKRHRAERVNNTFGNVSVIPAHDVVVFTPGEVFKTAVKES